jgi:hypothetical protein
LAAQQELRIRDLLIHFPVQGFWEKLIDSSPCCKERL